MRIPKIKITNTENIYHIPLTIILVFFTWELYKIYLILKDSSYILTKVNPTPENIDDFNKIILQYDLIDKVANYNLMYLGISITILIFIGGLFYFLSVKPLQDKLKKYEDDLSKTKEETESNFKKMEDKINIFNIEKTKETEKTAKILREEIIDLIDVTSKKINILDKESKELINKADKELIDLKIKYRQTELDILWNNHWTWVGQKVHENTIATLYYFMEKAIKYDMVHNENLWCDSILDALKLVKETSKIYGSKLYEDILLILDKVGKDEDRKELIKKEIYRILQR